MSRNGRRQVLDLERVPFDPEAFDDVPRTQTQRPEVENTQALLSSTPWEHRCLREVALPRQCCICLLDFDGETLLGETAARGCGTAAPQLHHSCGTAAANLWHSFGAVVAQLWHSCVAAAAQLQGSCVTAVSQLRRTCGTAAARH